MAGVATQPMAIPPLAKLREHLSPAGSFCWTDEAGWHSRSLSPFPCSTVIMSPTTLMMVGIAPAVAIPAFKKAQERAQGF